MTTCSICGGTSFKNQTVLWDKLATEWQVSPAERAYIDRQQGTVCTNCGSNLRSIALADAIRQVVGTTQTLQVFVATKAASQLAVLEINEAGTLNGTLRKMPGHRLVTYPDVDMQAMPYPDRQFDLIIHSDTLEHIPHPVSALAECRRVLKPGGWLCFTIPTIVGRLSRSRSGLEKSFHGDANTGTDDHLVHTEFGADMWMTVLEAGFSAVTINTVEFPAALALSARKVVM